MTDTLYHRYAHLRRIAKYGLKYFLAGNKTHILIACTPKSGSTFLWTILSQIPAYKKVSLIPGSDRRENELCKEKLIVNHRLNYVARLHIRYSQPTRELMESFYLRPVVCVRNIYDSVISLKDHIFKQRPALSMINSVDKDFKNWDSAKQDEFIVDLAIPWYINFFVSWSECHNKALVTYEELNRDSLCTVKRLLSELGISASNETIGEYIKAAEKTDTLKNVATVGRGEALSQYLKNRMRRFASYYPGVDFTPLGIHL